MYIDSTYKNRLAMKLSHRMGKAIQTGELPGSEITDACEMILAAIDTMTTKQDVEAFFDKLSLCWPFFQEVVEEQDKKDTIVSNITQQFYARAKAP